MKIKLALLDSNIGYLRRIVAVFHSKFTNELEVYSFTELNSALNCLEDKKIDILLTIWDFT